MEPLCLLLIASGVLFSNAKEAAESNTTDIPLNKTRVWSQPDMSGFTVPLETSAGFSVSQISDASYGQPDQRSMKPFFPSDLPQAKDSEDKEVTKASKDSPQVKSASDNSKHSHEFVNHPQGLFYPHTPQKKNVVFEGSGGYKPVKFEDDFPSTRFTPDHVTKGYGLAPSHPYPYQFVNAFGDGAIDPAPTASAHHSYALHEHGHDIYGGGKKAIHHGGHMKSMWDKVVRLLAAFIPLGLFLVALPPNILNINSTNPTTIGRQRADDGDSLAVMSLFERFGFDSLDKAECEGRVFCEIARMGASASSNVVQQGIWQLAHNTPDNMADALGFKHIFTAIRDDTCEVFKCPEKKKLEKDKERKKIKSEKEETTL